MKLPTVVLGIEWASPGYFSYSWDWWFSVSSGTGDMGGHRALTILGLTFALRVYGRD